MNTSNISKTLLLAVMLFYIESAVLADDTELYTNNTSATAGAPLVMFSLDNRANILGSTVCQDKTVDGATVNPCQTLVDSGYLASTPATRIEYLKATMKAALDEFSGIRIGLMLSHDNTQNCAGRDSSGCSGGAYILKGISSDKLTEKTYAEGDPVKVDFIDTLGYLGSKGGNTSHPFQGKELFFEFFRYITGQDVYSGHLGWTDYGTDSSYNLSNPNDKYQLMRDLEIEGKTFIGNATTDEDKQKNESVYNTPGNYISPINENCSKIFTVNFAFGTMNNEDDADAAIQASTSSGGMGLNLTGTSDSVTTLLKFMHQQDFSSDKWPSDSALPYNGEQNVTSFWIVEAPDPPAGMPDHKKQAFIDDALSRYNSWAAAGGTTSAYPWSDDPTELIQNIKIILNQILSVSTTFTAASVPVSVLNRAQVVDNVYIALFRADENGKVRWPGNVKKLRLDLDQGLLVDANSTAAIDTDGRIKQSALTYWTHSDQLPAADTDAGEVDGKDGRTVERGGSGQNIPGYMSGTAGVTGDPGLSNSSTTRRLFYYDPADFTDGLAPLNADTTTVTALKTYLNAADDADALNLIKYIRGYDVLDEDTDSKTDEAREWIMGDPLHSRPLPINYGNRDNNYHDDYPDIRILFGTNDGLFHMIKNTSGSATITQEGVESWAFMPQEVMGVATQLRSNKVADHVYGVDGAPAAYVVDADNNGVIGNHTDDKAWVFFGLRRGGRGYYALDVTDPDNPKFMWRITTSTTGFSNLGYTFSNPRVGELNYDGSGAKPVLVFGGGYDLNKDNKILGTSDTMGKGIYIVDALSGKLVKHLLHADMDDSIPSDMSVIDTDGDGLLDRGYVGDMGGRVWRVDLVSDSSNWFVTKLADLGRHYNPGLITDDRRFFHRPDFVQYRDSTKDYDAVIVASGNRSDPLGLKVENYVYMIKDTSITSGKVSGTVIKHYDADSSVAQLDDVTDNCLQDSSCTTNPSLTYGWRMKLSTVGEKSLATPTTLAKKIYVTTFLPPGSGDDGSCDPDEGSGRLYALSLDDARAVNDYTIDGNETLTTDDRYVDLQSGGIPAEVVYVPFNKILKPDLTLENVGVSGRWDTYWYKEEN